MDKMVAFCGITCTDCKAFIATKEKDEAAKKAIAKEWEVQPEDVDCEGCTNPDGRHISYWSACEIRKCGTQKGVANCAYCTDYACEQLQKFHEHAPKAKTTLEELQQ